MPVTRSTKDHRSHQKSARMKDRTLLSVNNEVWVAKKMQGNYPPLTVTSRTVIDPCRGKVYLYGGFIDKAQTPTPNFHAFDTKTMKFTDLTNALTYVTPGNPHSDAVPRRQCKPLPSLSQPGLALLELKGHPIILMFGGYDVGDVDGPSSTLIAIDVEHKEWRVVDAERGNFPPPAPRINPILVGVEEKLYIFDGIMAFEEPWIYHRTYSIVDFHFEGSSYKCKWAAVDVPYPKNVPTNKVFGRGLPVHGGTMILLLPGRLRYRKKIQYKRDGVFYFRTKNNTFLQAKVKGELPKNVHWDFAFNYDPTLTASGGLLSSGSTPIIPSVFICTWLPYGGKYLSPELWKYTIFPRDTFVRLGISERVFNLEKDFQLFSLIGNRAFLMGWGEQRRNKHARGLKKRKIIKEEDVVKSGTEDETDTEEEVMCNTYVEIPIQALSPKIKVEDE